MAKKTSIRDIYDCDSFSVWRDDECIFLNIHHNACTLVLCPESWEFMKRDFRQMLKSNVVEIATRKNDSKEEG